MSRKSVLGAVLVLLALPAVFALAEAVSRNAERPVRLLLEVNVASDPAKFGFAPAEAVERPGHLGLVSMRERARVAGGWLKLESRPGMGTMVTFWVADVPGTDPLLDAVRGV